MLNSNLRRLGARILQRRWNSTFDELIKDLASGKPTNSERIASTLSNKTYTPEELDSIRDLIKSSELSTETTNELLHHGLLNDFSLYFSVKSKDHKWNDKSLLSLIKHNPGRVQSLWDLLKKHGISVSDEVRLAVVEKLILGEKSEQRENEVDVTSAKLARAMELLSEIGELTKVEQQLHLIVDHLVEHGDAPALSLLKVKGFLEWLNGSKLADIESKTAFMQIAKLIFDYKPALLTKAMLCRVLSISEIEPSPSTKTLMEELGSEYSELEAREFRAEVLQYIEANKLDLDKKDAEALLLRIQLIETYGMFLDEIQTAVDKFHLYQTHEKFGIELVQTKLVQAFCYQAVKKLDETSLKIAETLVVQDELPVKTIAHLILASSQFDIDRSLALYNDYIKQVSTLVNTSTGRSPSGILTEALMIANLYDNDREFAQLLYEKAILNKILVNELEISNIKKVFKVYGDAYVDDNWEMAKPRLQEYVLQTIRRL